MSGDDFRYRYGLDRLHLPWNAIERFDLVNLDPLDWSHRRHLDGVRLVLIKTTDERGQAARLPLADIEWSDSSYAEAVRVRDWLNGYVERHGRTRR